MVFHRNDASANSPYAEDVSRFRRWLISIVATLMLVSGMGWLVPAEVAAGRTASMQYHGVSVGVQAHAQNWDSDLSSTVKESLRSAVSPQSGGERWIDIDRSTGQVTLYEGNTALHVFWASLSRNSSNGFYATASGTYYVYTKHKPLTYTPFADNYITHWVGFDEYRRNGFHSWTKDANGSIIPNGAGYTAGCVSLPPGDIQILYNFAFVGMRVEIHW